MTAFHCTCGNTLYFENSLCLGCGKAVAFDRVTSLIRPYLDDPTVRLCANGSQYGVCNWLIPSNSANPLCLACQFNRVIPDLTQQVNLERWTAMEMAKHRAVYTMFRLSLPLVSRTTHPTTGLAFDFLHPTPERPVITGHAAGVITMNLDEADDATREHNRQLLREPYRTLAGHFRHELGHYFWWLWLEQGSGDQAALDAFRLVFGDERTDYAAAANTHYQNGAPAGWQAQFISSYATMHPWEDWAETWAHYLHITDALETVQALGLENGARLSPVSSFDGWDISLPSPFDQRDPAHFLEMLRRWSALTPALNEISLSLGHRDLYPFVLNAPVAKKLHLVHSLIRRMVELEA